MFMNQLGFYLFPFLLLAILYINIMNFRYFTDSWDSITPPLQGSRNGDCKWEGAKKTRAKDGKVYINKISSGWDMAVAFISQNTRLGSSILVLRWHVMLSVADTLYSSFLVYLIWWFVHINDFISSLLSFTADILLCSCLAEWLLPFL